MAGKAWRAAARSRDWGLRLTGMFPTNFARAALYRHFFGIRLGRRARIEGGCTIWGPGRITIGENTVINRGVLLDGRFPLTIGKHVSVSIFAIILTLEPDLSVSERFQPVGAPVVVGDRAVIGTRAIILPGVTIGEGAAVAAGAVVTKDVEPFTIVAGVPAKPIGTRPRDLSYRLS